MSKKTSKKEDPAHTGPHHPKNELEHGTEAETEKKPKAHPTGELKPEKNSGVKCFDIESHKITEIFESGDVVFTREGGAGELRAQPKHEAKTRFVEIKEKSMESKFEDNQTTTVFELADGRKVTQKGHKTIIVDKNKDIDDSGPRLNVHAADFQG